MACPGLRADPRLLRFVRATVLAIGLTARPAEAQEPLIARVLTVEPERVTLKIEGSGAAAQAPLVVPIGAGDLPEGIVAGVLVRLWPGTAGEMGGPGARARLVPLDGDLGVKDRTGVRARLMYGTQRGFGGFGGGRGGR